MSGAGVGTQVARRLAAWDRLPTAQRAVLGYYAETGTFDYRALDLKSRVDDTLEGILAELYADVEAELASAFGVEAVRFEYDTKLTLPAELTLGYLYRRALSRAEGGYDPVADEPVGGGVLRRLPGLTGRRDGAAHRRSVNREAVEYAREAREMTAFVVCALLDGDMRDAINDDEFEDFVVDFPADDPPDAEPRRIASVAQSCLQGRVEAGFASYPEGVRAAYDHAVEVSEAHQAADPRFRELMTAASETGGPADANPSTTAGETLTPSEARTAIEDEYKYRSMADDDHPFSDEELELPYLATQYDRVGVIYHGMLDMYRAAGFEIESAFERSVVFAIIGAQVWLDDVDDYEDDVADGQLTPVTAEYLLADSDRAAFDTVVEVSETYFDRARRFADAADSTLTGIAVEYILRSGDVSHLPQGES
jgi:hypothetical protein